MTKRSAGPRRCRLERRDPGADHYGDALPGGLVVALQQLECKGRHGVDAGVA
jgi:hypothetical protein